MGIDVHFSEQDWERVGRDWIDWWAGELDRPLVAIEGTELSPGTSLPEIHKFACSYPREMPADSVLDHYQAHLEARRFYGDAWPK